MAKRRRSCKYGKRADGKCRKRPRKRSRRGLRGCPCGA